MSKNILSLDREKKVDYLYYKETLSLTDKSHFLLINRDCKVILIVNPLDDTENSLDDIYKEWYFWWNLIPLDWLYSFLRITIFERELVRTLENDWYHLIWETNLWWTVPDYVVDFIHNFNSLIKPNSLRQVKREWRENKLIFIKLIYEKPWTFDNLNFTLPDIDRVKKEIQELIKSF